MSITKKNIKRLIIKNAPLFWFASFITKKIPEEYLYIIDFVDIETFDSNKIDNVNFEWQVKILKQKWNIISLKDYIVLRKNNATIPSYSVILTIDDGYYDFYKYAYPILKNNNFVATLFPTVNFVNQEQWLWHDKLHYILSKTINKKFELNFSGK